MMKKLRLENTWVFMGIQSIVCQLITGVLAILVLLYSLLSNMPIMNRGLVFPTLLSFIVGFLLSLSLFTLSIIGFIIFIKDK